MNTIISLLHYPFNVYVIIGLIACVYVTIKGKDSYNQTIDRFIEENDDSLPFTEGFVRNLGWVILTICAIIMWPSILFKMFGRRIRKDNKS